MGEQQDREFEEGLLADQMRQGEASDAVGASGGDGSANVQTACDAAAAAVNGPEDTAASTPETSVADTAAVMEDERQRRKAAILAVAEPIADGSRTAKIQLKLPSGERLQRIFRAEQLVGEVYEWADCCRPDPTPPRFELCTTFPTRPLADRAVTTNEAGLTPSA